MKLIEKVRILFHQLKMVFSDNFATNINRIFVIILLTLMAIYG